MNDVLLEIGKNKRARSIVQALGLPLPLPAALTRDKGPWKERPLADRTIAVAATEKSQLVPVLARALAAAGADVVWKGPDAFFSAFAAPGEAFGRPARLLDTLAEGKRVAAVVVDGTGICDIAGLRTLYDLLHPLVGRIERSGRVIVLGSETRADAEASAAQAALEGFVRSVAKEIGRNGATANLVRVAPGAEERLAPVLRFLLSPRSAFISAQPLVIDTAAKAPKSVISFVKPLEKKIAVVTGAARGIGEATARLLAQEGAHVICLDRPQDDGPTSQLARSIGGTPLLVDMRAEDAPSRIVDAVKVFGGVDIIVHNAGITRDKTLGRMRAEQWDEVLGVNLESVIRTNAALEPHLRNEGRVICLSSIAGLAGNVGQAAYAASKAGIVGFVKAKAAELGGRGITVNAIAPGFIETRLTAAIPLAVREAGRRLAALGQGGLPEDVGQAIVFLASPGAYGLTGRTIRVCGGALIGA